MMMDSKEQVQMESESAWHEMPLRIWVGLAAAPLAFAIHMAAGYILVPAICANRYSELPLHLVAIVTFALAATGTYVAWRSWRNAGRGWPTDAGTTTERIRFMSAWGALMSALLALAILAQWSASLFYGACD